MVGVAGSFLLVCFGHYDHYVNIPRRPYQLQVGISVTNPSSSVYAILPAVSQKELDKTHLTLHSLEIRDPTATSFSLSINSTISGASGIASHAKLDPMTVNFYLPDSEDAFMSLPLPGISGGGDIPIIVQDVHTEIADMKQFGGFAGLLLSSKELSFDIKGRTTIHVGKLHTKVNYNEVVELKGL